MRQWRTSAGRIAVAAMVLSGTALLAQNGGAAAPAQFGAPGIQDDRGMTMGETPQMVARRVRALNEMRQKAMVADANKLLKLAFELNAIDKDGIGISPSDRMKKLAEIEKLAKSVREKMSFGGWAVPGPEPQFTVLQP